MKKQTKTNEELAHTVESMSIDLAYAMQQIRRVDDGKSSPRITIDCLGRAYDALLRIEDLVNHITAKQPAKDYEAKYTPAIETNGAACTICGEHEALVSLGKQKLCGHCELMTVANGSN